MTRATPKRTSRAGSWVLFASIALAATAALNALAGVFPGDREGAYLGRVAGCLILAATLVAVSVKLLKRDGLPADLLGLAPTTSHARAFLIGCLWALGLMVVWFAAMRLVVPFDWRPGPRSASSVALAGLTYLCGNSIEELLFRGYAFVALARAFGATRALWLLALPFGLLHAPGLDATALGKMILTTGAMHFIFAYAYLASRSLWAAISLHALVNVLLHAVSGFGQGASAYEVVLHHPLPTGFDLPFTIHLVVTIAAALSLSRLPAVRRGVAWMEARSMPREATPA